MNFKELLNKDIDIFLNVNEFADEHNIDGKQMNILIDNDLLEEYKLKNGGEGLEQVELLFYANKSNFEKKPSTNKIMRVDNKIYRVFDVTEENGMYKIKLTRNQS